MVTPRVNRGPAGKSRKQRVVHRGRSNLESLISRIPPNRRGAFMKSPIMSRGQKSNSADQSIPVARELPTGERSSRGSNGHANGTNGTRKKKEPKDPTMLDRKQLLEALLAFKK